ncbi:MAG: uL15 family ribosomal protein [Candidatus Diapherotrites archaeon]
MVVRSKKTTRNKQRGERTHGHGDTKNRRGAGNRGGRGKAGSHKHKFSKYHATFGVKVRQNPRTTKGIAINVSQLASYLPKWADQGKIVQEDGLWIIDGRKVGVSKLLGSGIVPENLYIRHIKVSEKARQKIEEAEGEIEDTFNADAGETKVNDPSLRDGDA